MREELPKVLAFLFLASAIGLLEIAAAKAFARAVREAREDWRVWRFRRQLRAYEANNASANERARGDR